MSDASLNAACGHTRRRFLSRTLIAGGGLAAVGLGAGAIAPAYGMRGNFYSPATLTPDGSGVAAGGPLEWDADDVAATIVITVSQRGLTAHGAGRYDSGDAAWWESLAVAEPGRLRPGGATGFGVAVVTTSAGRLGTYRWSEAIVLE
jgi:hypothetical protein